MNQYIDQQFHTIAAALTHLSCFLIKAKNKCYMVTCTNTVALTDLRIIG